MENMETKQCVVRIDDKIVSVNLDDDSSKMPSAILNMMKAVYDKYPYYNY